MTNTILKNAKADEAAKQLDILVHFFTNRIVEGMY